MNARLRAALLVALALALAIPWASLSAPPARAAGQLETYLAGAQWPIALAFSPTFASDGRVYMNERYTGSIRVVVNGTLLPQPFFTLPGTATAGERGLLGLAIDPGFPASPYVYAYQTYNDAANATVYNRIVRVRSAPGGLTGLGYDVILRLPDLSAATNHNGGVIGFGPDGKLYAVVGENANPAYSQDPMTPLGKVLRMNPDGSPPADNPFFGSLVWDNLVYTYGHRNMFGLAFHPVTRAAWVTENGPACNDEINLLLPGRNYGWGPTETCATPPAPPNNTNRDGPSPVLPLVWYTPPIAPTGAAFVSGPTFRAWTGDLLFGDYNTRSLRHLLLNAPSYDRVLGQDVVLTLPEAIIDVKMGPDGAIWITTPSTIYRYVDVSLPPVASFTANPIPTNPGVPVLFDASASRDPDGTIVSYAWDFGDGAAGTGVTARHAYAASGTYTVTLTVVDNESLSGTATGSVHINFPPRAAIAYSPTTIYKRADVTFDGSGSSDPDGGVVSWAWAFGDGATGAGVRAVHAYSREGTFLVSLTVGDEFGLTNTTTAAVRVWDRPPVITSADPASPGVGFPLGSSQTFSVVATDPDGDALTYTWRVDGIAEGGNASGLTVGGAAAGVHRVNVTVSDGSLAAWHEWIVTVGTSPPPASGTDWLPAAIAVALAVAAFAAFAVVGWRRRRKAPGAPPP